MVDNTQVYIVYALTLILFTLGCRNVILFIMKRFIQFEMLRIMELIGELFMCYVHSASLCLYGVHYSGLLSVLYFVCGLFTMCHYICVMFTSSSCVVCLFITRCHSMSSVTVFYAGSLLQVGDYILF